MSGDEHADGNGEGEFDSSVDDCDPSKTTSANGGIAVDGSLTLFRFAIPLIDSPLIR